MRLLPLRQRYLGAPLLEYNLRVPCRRISRAQDTCDHVLQYQVDIFHLFNIIAGHVDMQINHLAQLTAVVTREAHRPRPDLVRQLHSF